MDWRVVAFVLLAGSLNLGVVIWAALEHARTAIPDRRMPGYEHWMHERGLRP